MTKPDVIKAALSVGITDSFINALVTGAFKMMEQKQLLRCTIDRIENVYMKNCQRNYLAHWKKVRRRLFKDLIALQLKEFDRE